MTAMVGLAIAAYWIGSYLWVFRPWEYCGCGWVSKDSAGNCAGCGGAR